MKDLERFVPKYEVDGKVVSEQFNDLMDENPDLPGTERAKEIVASAVEGKKFATSDEGEEDVLYYNRFEQAEDRLRHMGEMKEQDAIRKEMERLYLKSHPEEKAAMRDKDEVAVAKAIYDSRGITKAQAVVVAEETDLVGRFVEGYGVKPKGQNTMQKNTFVIGKQGFGTNGFMTEVGLGGNQYAFLNRSKMDGGVKGRLVIDHEFLHTYQSPYCPGVLVEGTTTLYMEELQPTEERKKAFAKMIFAHDYQKLYKICKNYQEIVGKEALAKVYFEGDLDGFVAAYKESVGSTGGLEKQFKYLDKAMKIHQSDSALKYLLYGFSMTIFEQIAFRMSKKDLKKARQRGVNK